jgi:hypothetical protein
VIHYGKGFDFDRRRCFSFRCVSVQAQSIRRAVKLAAARYPGADVRVSFPIDAEVFFVEEPGSRAARLWRERPDRVAA